MTDPIPDPPNYLAFATRTEAGYRSDEDRDQDVFVDKVRVTKEKEPKDPPKDPGNGNIKPPKNNNGQA